MVSGFNDLFTSCVEEFHPSIHDQTSNGHKSVMSPNQQYPLTDDLHNTDQKILGLGNPFRLNFGMYHIPKHC